MKEQNLKNLRLKIDNLDEQIQGPHGCMISGNYTNAQVHRGHMNVQIQKAWGPPECTSSGSHMNVQM